MTFKWRETRLWVIGKKIVPGLCIAFTLIILVIVLTPISFYLAKPLLMDPDLQKTDLIAVLGGGAYRNGILSSASNERLIRGLLLYKEGYAPKILFSGGTISSRSKKIVHTLVKTADSSGINGVEAESMGRIVRNLGIPEKDIAIDAESTQTYGNLKAVKDYMDANGLRSCLITTSPTHMHRSYLVAKKLGMDCHPAPVQDYTQYINGFVGRLDLAAAVMWEYAGLLLYILYGYI